MEQAFEDGKLPFHGTVMKNNLIEINLINNSRKKSLLISLYFIIIACTICCYSYLSFSHHYTKLCELKTDLEVIYQFTHVHFFSVFFFAVYLETIPQSEVFTIILKNNEIFINELVLTFLGKFFKPLRNKNSLHELF